MHQAVGELLVGERQYSGRHLLFFAALVDRFFQRPSICSLPPQMEPNFVIKISHLKYAPSYSTQRLQLITTMKRRDFYSRTVATYYSIFAQLEASLKKHEVSIEPRLNR